MAGWRDALEQAGPKLSLPSVSASVGLPQSYPRKMGLFTGCIDRSGTFRDSVPIADQILGRCRTSVASKVGASAMKALYYLGVTFSERVEVGEVLPLATAVDPEIRAGGYTPLGEALTRAVEKLRAFRKDVMEKESVIRQEYFLLFSDLVPSQESAEVTEKGFHDLELYVAEFKVSLIVLLPKSGVDEKWLSRVQGMAATIQILEDANPETLLEFIVEAVTNATAERKVY